MDKTKQIQVAMVVGGVIGIAAGFVIAGWLTAFAGLVIGWLVGAAVGAVIVRL
jgi:hypothetical protein